MIIMLWKLIVKFLKCKERNYVVTVWVGNELYTIRIERFMDIDEELEKWKKAYGAP